ncbi:MAG TPA: hypothetical protein VFV30_12465, partial [Novosphingobium sp.]|nr:hypothetical protein [Novosphingobium sp.]
RYATPKRFAEEMAKGAARSCPGATTSPVQTLQVYGRDAARMRADCPNNPDTGQPEVFWIVLIAGERDIHARQVAFRRIPNAKDAAWAEGIMAATRLCTQGLAAPGC